MSYGGVYHSAEASGADARNASANRREVTPLPGARWMDDEESTTCLQCWSHFDDLLNRRHHCRSCGGLFCKACSSRRALIPKGLCLLPPGSASGDAGVPQRVCGGCAEDLGSLGHWMSDNESAVCLQCCKFFDDFLVRRHHCRFCGGLFCGTCAKHTGLIPLGACLLPPSDELTRTEVELDCRAPQRLCGPCHVELAPQQDELAHSMARSTVAVDDTDRHSVSRFFNLPIKMTMQDEIRKATNTLHNYMPDNAIEGGDTIPKELLWGCTGIAFLTMMKGGFFFSGTVGTGLVVARMPNGVWSAPSAIMLANVGWGFQVGGEVSDVMFVLNSQEALESFMGRTQFTLGTELGISVGPLGRTAGSDLRAGKGGVAAAFAYAHSRGLYVGVSIETGVVVGRPDVNAAFYGRSDLTVRDLLMGHVPPPKGAQSLYKALKEVETAPMPWEVASLAYQRAYPQSVPRRLPRHPGDGPRYQPPPPPHHRGYPPHHPPPGYGRGPYGSRDYAYDGAGGPYGGYEDEGGAYYGGDRYDGRPSHGRSSQQAYDTATPVVITELPPGGNADASSVPDTSRTEPQQATVVGVKDDADATATERGGSISGSASGSSSSESSDAALAAQLGGTDLSGSGGSGGSSGDGGDDVSAREGESDAALAARLQAEEQEAFVREQQATATQAGLMRAHDPYGDVGALQHAANGRPVHPAVLKAQRAQQQQRQQQQQAAAHSGRYGSYGNSGGSRPVHPAVLRRQQQQQVQQQQQPRPQGQTASSSNANRAAAGSAPAGSAAEAPAATGWRAYAPAAFRGTPYEMPATEPYAGYGARGSAGGSNNSSTTSSTFGNVFGDSSIISSAAGYRTQSATTSTTAAPPAQPSRPPTAAVAAANSDPRRARYPLEGTWEYERRMRLLDNQLAEVGRATPPTQHEFKASGASNSFPRAASGPVNVHKAAPSSQAQPPSVTAAAGAAAPVPSASSMFDAPPVSEFDDAPPGTSAAAAPRAAAFVDDLSLDNPFAVAAAKEEASTAINQASAAALAAADAKAAEARTAAAEQLPAPLPKTAAQQAALDALFEAENNDSAPVASASLSSTASSSISSPLPEPLFPEPVEPAAATAGPGAPVAIPSPQPSEAAALKAAADPLLPAANPPVAAAGSTRAAAAVPVASEANPFADDDNDDDTGIIL